MYRCMADFFATIIYRWLAAGDAGDLDAFDDLLLPAAVIHAPRGLSTTSREAEKAVWRDALAAMPDLRHHVQEVLVGPDIEMARVVVTGTMAATFAAAPGLVSAQELAWYPGRGLVAPAGPRRSPRASYQLGALLRHNFVNFGFFSRELYELAGGFPDQYCCEDWLLWIRMVRAGARVTMASHPTAVHRVRPGSLSFDPARTAQSGIDALTAELRAANSPAEAAAARAGLRALRGKLSFYRATELAARGQPRKARRAAFEGLPGGGPRAAAGLLALLVAPASAARLERSTRSHRSPVGAPSSAGGEGNQVTGSR